MRISSISEYNRSLLPAQVRHLQSREHQYKQAKFECNQIPNAYYAPVFTSRMSIASLQKEAGLLFQNNENIVNKSLLEHKDDLISTIRNSSQLNYLKKCLETKCNLDKIFNKRREYDNVASLVYYNLLFIGSNPKLAKVHSSALDCAEQCCYNHTMLQLLFNANRECLTAFLNYLGKNSKDFLDFQFMNRIGDTLFEIDSSEDAKLYVNILKGYQKRSKGFEQKANKIFETNKTTYGKEAIYKQKDNIVSDLVWTYKKEFLEAFDSADKEQKKQLLSNEDAGSLRLEFLKDLLNSNINFDTTDICKMDEAKSAVASIKEVVNSIKTKEDYEVKKNALQFMDKHNLALNYNFVGNHGFEFFHPHAQNKH